MIATLGFWPSGTLLVGDQVPGGWTVYTVWRPSLDMGVVETAHMFPDWPAARHEALSLYCCNGVRSATVVDPDHVVAGDIDKLDGRWREYRLHIGECDNYRETEDEPCDGQLYAKPDDVQVQCPRCRGWTGVRAPGMRLPYDPAGVNR